MGRLNDRNHRAIMYRLKREYGQTVYLYRPTSQSHDVLTGVISRNFRIYTIKRAPVLPHSQQRTFVYDLDYIQAGNNFTEGAFFDRNTVHVLVDLRDFPKRFKPTLDDHVVIDARRYDIRQIELFERLSSWRFFLSVPENSVKEKWLMLGNIINFANETDGTV